MTVEVMQHSLYTGCNISQHISDTKLWILQKILPEEISSKIFHFAHLDRNYDISYSYYHNMSIQYIRKRISNLSSNRKIKTYLKYVRLCVILKNGAIHPK